ncbi:hypothetical protein XENORESO_011692 [Xenotaenia resolanae]|uniref:Uncharacterized protein n=1 Tax=Xenotaenia resolanae TaxID=208358 RepID=A0ABV0VYQ8_9TELE
MWPDSNVILLEKSWNPPGRGIVSGEEHSLPGSVQIQEGVSTTNGGLEQVSHRSHLEQVTGRSQSSFRKYFKKSFTANCKVFRADQKITTEGKTLRRRSVGNPSSLCLQPSVGIVLVAGSR